MDIRRDDLTWAEGQGLLAPEQAERLWAAWSKRDHEAVRPRFDLAHVAYYLGALIVMGAMGFFMTLGWESFGGAGIFAIALVYVAIFAGVGVRLWRRPVEEGLRIPAGLLVTVAVSITPLVVYGFERMAGLWPGTDPGSFRDFHVYVRSGWLWMELETMAAGLIALRFVRFPFLVAPVAFVLWYMSMDLTPVLTDGSWNDRAHVSIAIGLAILLAAYLVDRQTREDFAFWLYLFGMFAFWGGLSSVEGGNELARLGYLSINVALLLVAVVLERKVFLVFGALGIFGYLSYESWHLFANSIAFPFVLSAIGILVLVGGVKYARARAAIDASVLRAAPSWLTRLRPTARAQG